MTDELDLDAIQASLDTASSPLFQVGGAARSDFDALIAEVKRLRAATVKPDREAVRDEISGHPIGRGYYSTQVGVDEAGEIADAVLALWPGRTEAEVKAEAGAALNEHMRAASIRVIDVFEHAAEGASAGEVMPLVFEALRLPATFSARADRIAAEGDGA